MTKYNMSKNPVHLGLGATAVVEPEMTGDMEWYGGYAERHASDGAEGRLVSLFTFTEPWTMWEMHPKGTEVVMCTAGEMTLIQELADGTHDAVKISAGEFVINPPGVWHTADVDYRR